MSINWRDYGITEAAHPRCDRALVHVMEAIRELDGNTQLLNAVIKEAVFQIKELPNRSGSAQKKMRK